MTLELFLLRIFFTVVVTDANFLLNNRTHIMKVFIYDFCTSTVMCFLLFGSAIANSTVFIRGLLVHHFQIRHFHAIVFWFIIFQVCHFHSTAYYQQVLPMPIFLMCYYGSVTGGV